MGYDGNGFGISGQGMINPIQVEERPCFVGFVFGKGESGGYPKLVEVNSKMVEAREDSSK